MVASHFQTFKALLDEWEASNNSLSTVGYEYLLVARMSVTMLALLWAHELGHIFIAMGKRADLGERPKCWP